VTSAVTPPRQPYASEAPKTNAAMYTATGTLPSFRSSSTALHGLEAAAGADAATGAEGRSDAPSGAGFSGTLAAIPRKRNCAGQSPRQQSKHQVTHQRQRGPLTGMASAAMETPLSTLAPSEPFAVVDVKKDAARLLYPNPVCFLGTVDESGTPNLMTISWLTPVTNEGSVFFSVNERRSSATNLARTGACVLSIAMDGQQSDLVAVGSCHGPQPLGAESTRVSKPEALGIPITSPGWGGSELSLPAVEAAGAHVVLKLQSMDTVEGHHRVFCKVTGAWVRAELWEGRTWKLPEGDTGPTILTFLGSRKFGRVVAAALPAKPRTDLR
jgi:flavin reductase (DIM6/NTAB) family NADH-FMN oxidoreductase RutF